MTARRPAHDQSAKKPKRAVSKSSSVSDLLNALEHPFKTEIVRLRQAILGLDSRITEEVKWNAPSFKLDDHFATFKLHPPKQLQLVLHTGSKPTVPPRQFKLYAAEALVKWAAPDRCVVTLTSQADAREHEHEVIAIVRQWMAQL